jgi:hypothetical protein
MNLIEMGSGFLIGFVIGFLLTSLLRYLLKDNRVAYIDISGSMSQKMISEAIAKAEKLGIKKAAYFNDKVSDIRSLEQTKSILSFRKHGEGGTSVDFLLKLPKGVKPHIFSDGYVCEPDLLRKCNATMHIIAIK